MCAELERFGEVDAIRAQVERERAEAEAELRRQLQAAPEGEATAPGAAGRAVAAA